MLHLALSGAPRWEGGDDLRDFAYIHIAPYVDELAATYAEACAGLLPAEPPRDGFAGAPFTTHIENGAFPIRLVNGTRYDAMHWCRDELCGVFYTPDGTASPVLFFRPG